MTRCYSFLFNVIVSMVTFPLNNLGGAQSLTYHSQARSPFQSTGPLCYTPQRRFAMC